MAGVPLAEIPPPPPPPPPWELTAEARIATDRTLEVLLVHTKTRGDDLADTLRIVHKSAMIQLPTKKKKKMLTLTNARLLPTRLADRNGTAVNLRAVKECRCALGAHVGYDMMM